MASDLAYCRVCGYESSDPLPWGPNGDLASFEICPCCEVEWGYEDSRPEGARAYRAKWLAGGARWSEDDVPKDGLTTDERLSRVPEAYAHDGMVRFQEDWQKMSSDEREALVADGMAYGAALDEERSS